MFVWRSSCTCIYVKKIYIIYILEHWHTITVHHNSVTLFIQISACMLFTTCICNDSMYNYNNYILVIVNLNFDCFSTSIELKFKLIHLSVELALTLRR